MNAALRVYKTLLKRYGEQGWWPVFDPKTGLSVYGGVSRMNERIMFEICIGALLTQNVAWKNVEKSLALLKKSGLLTPRALDSADNEKIAGLIKSSGYFNQKAIKIRNFLVWFKKYNFSFKRIGLMDTAALRDELLSVKGIGPETADSILLYAMQRKIFVVDAYTKRVFSRLGLVGEGWDYDEVQSFFHRSFPGSIEMYNEYHALIVAHGKDFCKNRPLCDMCCLAKQCSWEPPAL